MKRDYFKDPLKYGEKIPYDDLYEVYIIQNRPKNELYKLFNCTKDKVKTSMKFYGLRKSMELRQKCLENTLMEKYGVTNIFSRTEYIKQKVTEKYGVDNPMKSSLVREKFKNTCMERYGTSHPNKVQANVDKIKKTNQEKYGGNAPACSPKIVEKIKSTNLDKYGETSPLKADNIKEKMLHTRMEKYGTLNTYRAPGAKDKLVKTSLERYGTESPNQNKEKKQKCKQTCIEKYGVEYSIQSPEVQKKSRETVMDKYGVEHIMQLPETQQKIRTTLKKHNSFRKSKAEEKVYNKLITKFPNTIRQYSTDPRYPFSCDFYIPELDLFIEYQGYQGHGGHVFDSENPQDIEQLKQWETKQTEINCYGKPKGQYKDYIKIWTISDPLKRQIAKENNLNWIEFFTIDEFNKWFEQQ